MHISEAEFRSIQRRLMDMGRSAHGRDDDEAAPGEGPGERMHLAGRESFNIRPISKEWRSWGRRPAYKTATANVAYIWRDPNPQDEFGPMPASFGQRAYELRAAGLMMPASAPLWASQGYSVWEEADAAARATGDPTELSAWHVVLGIPPKIDEQWWEWLVRSFVQKELVGKGAAVAYAIHSLKGEDGNWIIHPHAHLIVSGRFYRHDRRLGRRHPAWLSNWNAHLRLERAWNTRVGFAKVTGRARRGHHVGKPVPWEIA